MLNDVVGYATYDRWFYPSPGERCRAVILISQGIGAKLIINGDVAMRMPMEIGNFTLHENGAHVPVRQARLPGGLRRNPRHRRAGSGGHRAGRGGHRPRGGARGAAAAVQRRDDGGVPHRGPRPGARNRHRAGDREPHVVGDLWTDLSGDEEFPRQRRLFRKSRGLRRMGGLRRVSGQPDPTAADRGRRGRARGGARRAGAVRHHQSALRNVGRASQPEADDGCRGTDRSPAGHRMSTGTRR